MPLPRQERVLRFALTYLYEQHKTVLAGVTKSGQIASEHTINDAVKKLHDSLEWAEKVTADLERKERA